MTFSLSASAARHDGALPVADAASLWTAGTLLPREGADYAQFTPFAITGETPPCGSGACPAAKLALFAQAGGVSDLAPVPAAARSGGWTMTAAMTLCLLLAGAIGLAHRPYARARSASSAGRSNLSSKPIT